MTIIVHINYPNGFTSPHVVNVRGQRRYQIELQSKRPEERQRPQGIGCRFSVALRSDYAGNA